MNLHENLSKVPLIAEHLLNYLEGRGTKSRNILYNILIVASLQEALFNNVSDEDLTSLHSVFGAVFQRACDILERYPTFVEYTTSNKSRILIEIKGENDHCYRVFSKINYCPCQAFKNQVLDRKKEVSCKHVLAARLAQVLGRTTCHEVTQAQYLMLVKSMFELE